MILADQFECVIPTANAVKQGVLHCTTNPPVPASESQTWAAWITAVATLLLVVGAFWAGVVAVSTLRQMKHDSLARTRPYLYATLMPSLSGGPTFDLIIENTGASTAREVKLDSPDYPDEPDEIAEWLRPFLNSKHTFPPKARTRNYWHMLVKPEHTWVDGTNAPQGMPEQSTITLSYKDDEGRSYKDSYSLDVETLIGAPMPGEGMRVESHLSAAQKDLHEMLVLIAVNIGELRR